MLVPRPLPVGLEPVAVGGGRGDLLLEGVAVGGGSGNLGLKPVAFGGGKGEVGLRARRSQRQRRARP